MKSSEIREKFLKYFESAGHRRVKSSSLIPAADPTLLFTNAGMNQFKDCFLGLQDLGFRRATTSQKCVRAGGKHNDLENVGFTARHHTFFEMLGNFSFGDYFKKEAIAFAWELLTKQYAIPVEKLRVTVFEKDDEAYDLWKAQGVRTEALSRLGAADNFWAMGDTGPCGPCTEIHFDWGEQHGFGPGDTSPGGDSTRFVEIWNLVFMQFNRDSSGAMAPLPKPSVDTGAGLERLSAVLQGVYSNYDTDVFLPILHAIGSRVGIPYAKDEGTSVSMRVIADHIRAGTFLISDGVTPSNEGRGYVLRRILRRAIRHGKKLGQETPFLHTLVSTVTNHMGAVYPEIAQNRESIQTLVREEEERFHETLHRGMGILEEAIAKTKTQNAKAISGDVAFKLYDTFGFPKDLIEVIAKEQGLEVDSAGFDVLMEKQRQSSAWSTGENADLLGRVARALDSRDLSTHFLGYEGVLSGEGTLLAAFDKEGNEVKSLSHSGMDVYLIFDGTPFYAESGGQVGDKGRVRSKDGSVEVEIADTFKVGKAFLHHGILRKGTLDTGKKVALEVNAELRKYTAINHTATHLLHAALRKVLGDRVRQAGSLVDPTRLRFDFTFPRGLTPEELRTIEADLNAQVLSGAEVKTFELSYDEAIRRGALAFFDEKYGDKVRLIQIGEEITPLSMELCGGTHLTQIGDIVLFKILSESSVASGVRRIEAITARAALSFLQDRAAQLGQLEKLIGSQGDALSQKVGQLQTQVKTLQKENEQLRVKLVSGGSGQGASTGGGGTQLWDKKVQVGAFQLVRELVADVNPKILRTLVDQVRDKLKEKTIVLLGTQSDGKVLFCLGLTKDLTEKWSASDLIQTVAKEVGGTGGGRADFAQAGGTRVEGIPAALTSLEGWAREHS